MEFLSSRRPQIRHPKNCRDDHPLRGLSLEIPYELLSILDILRDGLAVDI